MPTPTLRTAGAATLTLAPAPASDDVVVIAVPVSKVRRILRALSGLLLAVSAVTAVGTAVLVVFCQLSFAPVLSPSMEPELGAGDLVITTARGTSSISVGDVVVLPVPDSPGQRYVHRVVSVTHQAGGATVRTKGDANDAPDAWTLQVTSRQVPAVVGHVDNIGQLPLLLNNPPVRVGFIVVVALFALLSIKRALLPGRPSGSWGSTHAR